MQDLATDHTP